MSAASRLLALATVAGLVLGLAGCGKKGAPEAPGPGNEIIYPRSYPAR